MLILAIDTALGAVSACVYDAAAGDVLAQEREFLERGHAEALVPLLQRLGVQVPGGLSSVGRVAVTIGPGSFTGIRVGVAAARAVGLACGVDVIGVSTLAALAAPLLAPDGPQVASVIDARHGNVYFECYAPGGAILRSAAAMPVREAAASLGDSPTLLAGPGASLVAIEAWSQGRKVEVGGEPVSPDISFVAQLGAVGDPLESPASPLYLRPADVTVSARALALSGG